VADALREDFGPIIVTTNPAQAGASR
jgi:hypothetical protein